MKAASLKFKLHISTYAQGSFFLTGKLILCSLVTRGIFDTMPREKVKFSARPLFVGHPSHGTGTNTGWSNIPPMPGKDSRLVAPGNPRRPALAETRPLPIFTSTHLRCLPLAMSIPNLTRLCGTTPFPFGPERKRPAGSSRN
jgi:hypothetical protein